MSSEACAAMAAILDTVSHAPLPDGLFRDPVALRSPLGRIIARLKSSTYLRC